MSFQIVWNESVFVFDELVEAREFAEKVRRSTGVIVGIEEA